MPPEVPPPDTIAAAGLALARRALSPVDLVEACLARIARYDGMLRAYVTVTADRARAQARAAEQEIVRGGWRGPLHGIPLALKDIVQTAGIRTTCGSRVLADWVPGEDATVWRRLAAAGAILLGKLNMHEFAFRVPHPDFPTPRNPWDLERSCAGSSSGSGAAVAAGLCLGALGTDTGGSIRLPAAYCGIVGLKPTYGLVSRAGVVPLAWTLDHVGPMARTVEDAAILLEAIAGYDPADPASARRAPEPYRAGLGRDLRGVRVGVVRQLLEGVVAPEVVAATTGAAGVLRDLGLRVEPVELPRLDDALTAYRTIVFSEAAAYHQAQLAARAGDYGPRLREQLALGLAIPAAQYVNAQRLRREVIRALGALLQQVDILLCPSAPAEAQPIGQQGVAIDGVLHDSPVVISRFTSVFNIAGLPAISVPCGFSPGGLPLGLQLAGRPFADGLVLAVAWAYEQATGWTGRRPPLGPGLMTGRPARPGSGHR
ncbi:MAG: amidase [Armatimonadota bacterium]|nr:amidase [Armatimonadota bacterium]MDR7533249.1 amidase [Armatimonadota bacterium]MDR7536958.1 amidase [Armatimonadota bacterium]